MTFSILSSSSSPSTEEFDIVDDAAGAHFPSRRTLLRERVRDAGGDAPVSADEVVGNGDEDEAHEEGKVEAERERVLDGVAPSLRLR